MILFFIYIWLLQLTKHFQVCNWFANWRRKLKNAGKEPQRKTWGHLIKTYNTQVHGNVEHFSICSDDSIWGENETRSSDDYKLPPHDLKPDLLTSKPNYEPNPAMDHSYTERDPIKPETLNNNTESEPHQNQCFLISSTTENDVLEHNPFAQQKYKNHIMEKYLRDCQKPPSDFLEDVAKPSMISKWLESAVNFRPSENNYLNWTLSKGHRKKCGKKNGVSQESVNGVYLQHGREELDAAEALTTLASVHAERKL